MSNYLKIKKLGRLVFSNKVAKEDKIYRLTMLKIRELKNTSSPTTTPAIFAIKSGIVKAR